MKTIQILRFPDRHNKTLIRPGWFRFGMTTYLLALSLFPIVAKAQTAINFNGEKSSWHDGFDRYDFIMDDSTLQITPFKAPAGEGFGIKDPPPGKHRCIVVAPKQAAAGNPWSWQGCYWDHQPQTEVELLRRGFYIAYVSASATLRPGKEWDAWYKFLTTQGLSPKPAFIGMSRGGELNIPGQLIIPTWSPVFMLITPR